MVRMVKGPVESAVFWEARVQYHGVPQHQMMTEIAYIGDCQGEQDKMVRSFRGKYVLKQLGYLSNQIYSVPRPVCLGRTVSPAVATS